MRPTNEDPMFLWPAGAPGPATGQGEPPTITPFFPAESNPSGASVVVLPGGGYGMHADHEGTGYARWLNRQGIAAFVVKYRLGSFGHRHPAMLQDAARGVRTVRSYAGAWGLNPQRIAIMGSSAGGHLAATLSTHFDAGDAASSDPVMQVSSRPDAAILCYPVISLIDFAHAGSTKNLLGENPDPALVQDLSLDLQVTADTPRTFIFHTVEDKVVAVQHALAYATALSNKGVKFDLHIYENLGHGIGLGKDESHPWTVDLKYWLHEAGLLASPVLAEPTLTSSLEKTAAATDSPEEGVTLAPDGAIPGAGEPAAV